MEQAKRKKPAHLDQNLMGFYLSAIGWLVALMLSLFHLLFGVEMWKEMLLFAFNFIGLATSFLFIKKRNLSAVIIQTVMMFVAVLFSVIFPVAGPMVNLVFIYIAIFPLAMLESMNSMVILMNFAACVLAVVGSELAMNGAHQSLNEQIFMALLKFSIMSLVFFVVYMLRTVLEYRQNEIYERINDRQLD